MSSFARHSCIKFSPFCSIGLRTPGRADMVHRVGRVVRSSSHSSTAGPHQTHQPSSRRLVRVGLLSAGVAFSLSLGTIYADSTAVDNASAIATSQSIGSLIRSYVVFTMCSVPALVDISPKLLALMTSIPGIRQITEAFVRVTFFEQFVGGDTAQGTIPLLKELRAANKGALFAYSVEVDEDEAAGTKKLKKHDVKPPHKQSVDEMIRCIDVAADFEDTVLEGGKSATSGRKTWVAVKMTALLPDAQSLINLSSYIIASRPEFPIPVAFPGCPTLSDLDVLYTSPSDKARSVATTNTLTEDDIVSLRELHADLIRICQRAQERGVRVIIDAEYSWYQPAIDAITLSLTRQFNKLPEKKDASTAPVLPLIYGTYQAYLKRTPSHLRLSLLDAKKNNYALGVKLVRGAYHPHETLAHESRQAAQTHEVKKGRHPQSLSISPDPFPPVWTTKAETDSCYNECLKTLLSAVKEDVPAPRPSAPAIVTDKQSSWMAPTAWLANITGTTGSLSTLRVAPNSSNPNVPTIGVLFGTHNWTSCNLILDELVRNGLATREIILPGSQPIIHLEEDVTERVTMGQLYGMSNALTDYLASRTRSKSPLVIKYVPYGALAEVMPYLSRRAIENKSVLGDGGAADERRRAGREIWRRVFTSGPEA